MYFRNATVFQIPKQFLKELPDMGDALKERPLRPCGALEMATRGFVAPYADETREPVCTVGNCSLFAVGTNEKILPAAAVNLAVKERLRKINGGTGGPVSSKTRKRVKAEVLDELLPRALVKQTRTEAYIDSGKGLVVIDATSRKTAEAIITSLREVFGSFPATPLVPAEPVRALLTQWLAGSTKMPEGLDLGDECELRDPAGGAIARCGKQELDAREVLEHIKAGKQVYKLGLMFNGHVSFVLREDMTLMKVALLEDALAGLDESSDGSDEADVAAKLALMSGELSEVFDGLFKWFGVEPPSAI